MFYGKIFYNKELADMVYEYLKSIFSYKAKLEHRNGEYVVSVENPELERLTDLQREFVKFLMPHLK